MSSRCLIWVLVLACVGCATYEDRLRPVHEAFYSGRLAEAEENLRDQVDDGPVTDKTLLQIELASVLQARERYAEAAQLLAAADERLEVLDYSAAPIDALVEFAFAIDDVWRASPPERVMINTQNMLNYLGAGDLEGAAVEARRLVILLSQSDLTADERYSNSFGWGLAGIILAAGGDLEEAKDAFAQLPANNALRAPARPQGHGTILVVCQLGRAPIRRQARYWITTGGAPHQLNIPVMQKRPGGASSASVSLDGSDRGVVQMMFDLSDQLMRRYDDEFPRLVAAAVTQVVPRALAGKAIAKGVEMAIEDEGDSEAEEAAAELVGALVGFLGESAVAATQVADVRCWSLLPGNYGAMRLDVAPGQHSLSVALSGVGLPRQVSVDVGPGELVLVNIISEPGAGYRELAEPRGSDLTYQPVGLAALDLLEHGTWEYNELN